MGLFQGKPKRKASGGRFWPSRKKKAREVGTNPRKTTVSKENESRAIRACGGSHRTALIKASIANVMIGNKAKKVKIESFVENPSNRHYRFAI